MYSTELTVFDESGENSVILSISTNDASVINLYSATNFELLINPDEHISGNANSGTGIETGKFNGTPLVVKMGVIQENFTSHVERFEIIETEPDFSDLRASFTEKIYWTERDGIYCKRDSWNRRVYITTKYCTSGCNPILDDIKGEWANGYYGDEYLKNNEKKEDIECGSAYLALIVRCKIHGDGKYSWGGFIPEADQCK
jgi:hypothetical protein